MLSRVDAEKKLKELKSERKHWQKLSRHNPMQYVQEYIGTLDRRIAAYEKILPNTRELCYIVPKEEVKVLEYWDV